MQITAGSGDTSLSIFCRSLTGAALTGKVAGDFTLWYCRTDELQIAVSAVGIIEIGGGEYRQTFPLAAFAAGVPFVTIGGTVAGGVVLGYPIGVDTGDAYAIAIAQRVIDQTTTPWQLVLKNRTTGAELLRYDLKDASGASVNSIEDFVAEATTP